jgi:hypothetical protein
VDDAMPLTVGESRTFKEMIRAANKGITPPDHKAIKKTSLILKSWKLVKS